MPGSAPGGWDEVDRYRDAHPAASGDEAAQVRARKTALRRATGAARRGLTPTDAAVASAAAEERVWRLPELRRARTVALYAATDDEVDLTTLAGRLRDRGGRTAFPRVRGDHLELVITAVPTSTLDPGYRGIAEPVGPAVDLEVVDAVITPGVAFDPNGGRLGRGGGHYDRLLAALPDRTLRIGVGFACQLVPTVPREAHDRALDVVVTDRATYRTRVREGR